MTWLCFPSEGRRAEDFFALKNLMALAGFEPANLGTKGQHATSRPPKCCMVKKNYLLYFSCFLICRHLESICSLPVHILHTLQLLISCYS